MRHNHTGEKHFRVVRFYNDYNKGIFREELADGLTLEEAERLADQHRGEIPGEEVVIQDENQVGLDSEMLVDEELQDKTEF